MILRQERNAAGVLILEFWHPDVEIWHIGPNATPTDFPDGVGFDGHDWLCQCRRYSSGPVVTEFAITDASTSDTLELFITLDTGPLAPNDPHLLDVRAVDLSWTLDAGQLTARRNVSRP